MRRPLLVSVTFAALWVPQPAWAPPPIGVFPAAGAPAFGSAAPSNARIWAMGAGAPAPDQVSFTASVDGAPVVLALERLGCCAIVARLPSGLSGAAAARVVSGAAELTYQFTLTSTADRVAPTLASARVLEDLGGVLVIGPDGADDVQLAAYLARSGAEVVGAAPPGQLLRVTPGPARCVAVVAVDLAGQESPPIEVCGAAPDGGVAADAGTSADGGGSTDEPSGCAAGPTPSSAILAWIAALLLGARRLRRAGGAGSRSAQARYPRSASASR